MTMKTTIMGLPVNSSCSFFLIIWNNVIGLILRKPNVVCVVFISSKSHLCLLSVDGYA